MLLLGLAALLGWEAWRAWTPPSRLGEGPRIVVVPPSEGVLGIAVHLQDAGVIRSPEVFVALSLVRGSFRGLKAGEYEVPRSASTLDVLAMLESGRVLRHPVLHREGDSLAELARTLEQAGLASANDVLRVATDPSFLHAQGIDVASAEGYLFPDTYYFVRGMTPEQMLARMIQRTHAKLTADILELVRVRGLDVHGLLTLASIVEREAVAADERPVIAAVFWNRLRINMPLQADPTVQYAVGKERRALTRADLARDHPYNTYLHAGLPPGPIASPGMSAIEAVVHPADVKYLYFVKKDDQRHHFSVSIDEHNSAVTRYRLARNRN